MNCFPMTFAGVRAFAVVLCLMAAFGCRDTTEEEHLEHLIPPHKPASLKLAIQQLRSRGMAFYAGSASADQAAELADIIHWLPELAADSDVRRPQWERIQSITAELERHQQVAAASPAGDASQQRWDELVTELDGFIADAESTSPAASHELATDAGNDSHSSHVHSGEHD